MLQTLSINFELKDLQKVALQFIEHTKSHKKFVFYGEMGVGKTTLIKALCEALNVKENISSPTYSIVNEYEIADKLEATKKIFHMDLYRLKSFEEVLDIGIENYLDAKNDFCFIEWPQLIETILPLDCVSVTIKLNSDTSRTISIKNNG